MALRRPRDRQRPRHVVVLAVEIDRVDALAVGPLPRGGVADQGAVLPAVPESPDDVHELAGAGIAAVVFDQGALAEVPGRLRVVGGDDVPAGPAAADVIHRRQPPGQVERRAERGRRRRDQTDMRRGHRERGQHQQRILIRLRERPHPVGRDRQPVGEEHRVEQSALGQRRSPHQTLHADRIAGSRARAGASRLRDSRRVSGRR